MIRRLFLYNLWIDTTPPCLKTIISIFLRLQLAVGESFCHRFLWAEPHLKHSLLLAEYIYAKLNFSLISDLLYRVIINLKVILSRTSLSNLKKKAQSFYNCIWIKTTIAIWNWFCCLWIFFHHQPQSLINFPLSPYRSDRIDGEYVKKSSLFKNVILTILIFRGICLNR